MTVQYNLKVSDKQANAKLAQLDKYQTAVAEVQFQSLGVKFCF